MFSHLSTGIIAPYALKAIMVVHIRHVASHAIVGAALLLGIRWQYLLASIDAKAPAHQEFAIQKLSGVTGTLFSGAETRTFHGRRFFQEDPVKGNETSHEKAASQDHRLSSSSIPDARKWAVCTTVHAPTQAILDFVDSENWAVVIVGDRGMEPFRVNGPNTFFLDVAEQESLATSFPELLALLPWKHFGRKNLGYLFAVLHGAEQIWDFDDDNFLKKGIWPAFPDVQSQEEGHYRVEVQTNSDNNGAGSSGSSEDSNDDNNNNNNNNNNDNNNNSPCLAFNPLPLMGGDNGPTPMWPRGLPLNLVRNPCNHTLVPVQDMSTVAVLQSLADHEPDVDGIYRLTRDTPMTFDTGNGRTAKALVMPHGTLSPYNAQATLVARPAFWSPASRICARTGQ